MLKINKVQLKIYLLTHRRKTSGYTLLESLLALVVVGILITSVAPMLALTTASRIQARRVDLATQALRAYVDGVRGGTLPPPQRFVLPTSGLAEFKGPNYGFPPNTSLVGYISNPDPGTIIDTTGTGFDRLEPQHLVIQAIRPIANVCNPNPCDIGSATGRTAEAAAARREGFFMHVRVYRADAFQGTNVPTETEVSSTFIGSLGSPQKPIVTSVLQIFPSGALADTKYSDVTARTNRDFAAFGKF